MTQDYEHALIVKAAWYYYIENYTQQDISNMLGITRAKVITLLEKSRELAVIKFTVRQESEKRLQTEIDLISKFALKDAFIIPSPKDSTNLNDSIAKAASMYIGHRLEHNAFINMGYGDTVSKVLNYLAMTVEQSINVVSMTGGVNYYLPNTVSSIFNAHLYLIPSPLLLSSSEMMQAMQKETSVQEIRQMLKLSSMSIVGIGCIADDATIIKNGILTKNDLTYLSLKGAVGDLLSHFIDENGQTVSSEIEERLMSTDLHDLQSFKNVIGVAGGMHKITAINAVLKAKYLDVLITDENTANALLSY